MRATRYAIPGAHILGIEHEGGRLERKAVSIDESAETALFLQRAVDAYNACEGIPDDILKVLAAGGDSNGTLAERASLAVRLHRHNARLFFHLMQEVKAGAAKLMQRRKA